MCRALPGIEVTSLPSAGRLPEDDRHEKNFRSSLFNRVQPVCGVAETCTAKSWRSDSLARAAPNKRLRRILLVSARRPLAGGAEPIPWQRRRTPAPVRRLHPGGKQCRPPCRAQKSHPVFQEEGLGTVGGPGDSSGTRTPGAIRRLYPIRGRSKNSNRTAQPITVPTHARI